MVTPARGPRKPDTKPDSMTEEHPDVTSEDSPFPQPDPEPTTGRTVTAPLVTVRDSNGAVRYLYQGDRVPDGTTQDSIDHLDSLGYLDK